jgi:cell division protein FtsA
MSEIKKYQIVVGLDIGTTKIAAIVGQMDERGKISILGIGKSDSNGVARGEVVNIEMTVTAIKSAVADAERQSCVAISEVFVGIAGEHISSMQNNGIHSLGQPDTEVTESHVKSMIDDMFRIAVNPGEKIIHVIPQEFMIDNNPVPRTPVGMCGSRLSANFHIITGRVAAAQNIKKCVERAGLVMKGLILEPLASSASVLSEEETEAGVALVDIGGGTTDIAIFQDNVIRHTAVIPLAGNIITEDIKTGCMVLKKQAEKLKVRFGHALPEGTSDDEIISIPGIGGRPRKEISMRNLANIINARLEEIFQHVYFEIKSSGYHKKLIAGVVITGGGSQLKHLKQFVEYHTGLSTRIGFPTEYLVKETKEELKNPIFATGVGLIIKGYDYLREQGLLTLIDNEINEPEVVVQPTVKKVIATLPQEEEIDLDFDTEEVESTVEVKQEVVNEAPVKPRKRNWWDKLIDNTHEWFGDERVNSDNDFK